MYLHRAHGSGTFDGVTDEGVELEDGMLRLRPLRASDAEAWLAGEDDEVRRWFQFPRPSTRADVDEAIAAWSRSWREDGPVRFFGAWTIGSDSLVGGVELRQHGDAAYVSYQVFASYRRRGYATRAVRMAVIHAELVLPVERIVIITDASNTTSQRVALATGFRLDGPAEPHEHTEIGEMLRFVRP
jgi:RimJ/RimL family protein N-acetyltransferase